jgi:hypothetical protein
VPEGPFLGLTLARTEAIGGDTEALDADKLSHSEILSDCNLQSV